MPPADQRFTGYVWVTLSNSSRCSNPGADGSCGFPAGFPGFPLSLESGGRAGNAPLCHGSLGGCACPGILALLSCTREGRKRCSCWAISVQLEREVLLTPLATRLSVFAVTSNYTQSNPGCWGHIATMYGLLSKPNAITEEFGNNRRA